MPRIVPDDWMPSAQMERIHLHWTGGGHRANTTDLNYYHILVEGDGELRRGRYAIDANAPGALGPRASHTLNGNTGAIGVSLCCMAGAIERPFDCGKAPMTDIQWTRGIEVIADLAERYGILVTPTRILTHAEVEPNLNIRQRSKWDISRLPFDDRVQGHQAVGNAMRVRVAQLLGRGDTSEMGDGTLPDDLRLPKYRVTGVAPDVLNFRRSPGGEKVGQLPERTYVERLGVYGEWWQVRTRLGHVGFVHAAYLTAA